MSGFCDPSGVMSDFEIFPGVSLRSTPGYRSLNPPGSSASGADLWLHHFLKCSTCGSRKADQDRDFPLARLGDVDPKFLLDPLGIFGPVEPLAEGAVAVDGGDGQPVTPRIGPKRSSMPDRRLIADFGRARQQLVGFDPAIGETPPGKGWRRLILFLPIHPPSRTGCPWSRSGRGWPWRRLPRIAPA
jgi:hypothetical protein